MSGAANVLVLGKGTVASELYAQLYAVQPELSRLGALRLVGAADSRRSWFDAEGADPRAAAARLDAAGAREGLPALIDRLRRLQNPVLVDCTAADGMERVYALALAAGVHVVTANKKPLSAGRARRDALLALAERTGRALRYETTVGAGLPVIETLQNLVRTGDRVARIEGSLSGTLGYLASELSRGVALSQAVRRALSLGLTEPHPGEDLSGVDVARKALILGREIGLSLELGDVHVEPFVPAELSRHATPEALFAQLAAYDDAMARRVEALRARGRVLRYLATVEPEGAGAPARVCVGPVGVAEDHPAARLHGTEAFVAFHTDRYRAHPLVVQGPGAGGAVTAAGVLADVLAIARAGGARGAQSPLAGVRARASRSSAGVLPNQRIHAR